jgi:hypothetical protein
MKNAHLRFGWLTYVKSTEKTTTSIRLRLDRFIGEVLPDPPRQAKGHLISVIGGDTQVAAVSAAISLGEGSWWKGQVYSRFEYVSNETRSASKVRYSLPGARNLCVILSGCRKSSPQETSLPALARLFWQARTSDLFGLRLRTSTAFPEFRNVPRTLGARITNGRVQRP